MNEHLSKPIDVNCFYRFLLTYLDTGNASVPLLSPLPLDDPHMDLPCFHTLDTDTGLKHVAGNRSLYIRILNDFAEDFQSVELALNTRESRRMLHTIKGLAGNIGAKRLHRICTRLETAEDDLLLQQFYTALKEVIQEIREKAPLPAARVRDRNRPGISSEKREALFSALIKMVQKNRPKPCKKILAELAGYELSQKDQIIVEKAGRLLQKYQFKEALTVLKAKKGSQHEM
jgi:HPt (histidine-containing phosphotransfer) domain-containing protein